MMDTEWKGVLGEDYRVSFYPPSLVTDAPTATFLLSAHHQAGADVVLPLTALRAPVNVTVGSDGLALTADAPVAAAGLTGETMGRCWLDVEGEGRYPVVVNRVSGTTVELAEPLPSNVATDAAGVLYWNTWAATLTAAAAPDLLSTLRRGVNVRLNYTADGGTDGTDVAKVAHRVFHLVRQAFDTYLESSELHGLVPSLSVWVPNRQVNHAPQIKAALTELVIHLRNRGLVEDNAHGHDMTLRLVHANLAAAHILEGLRDTGADTEAAAKARRVHALKLLDAGGEQMAWYDADGNGVVDSGEVGYSATGPVGAQVVFKSGAGDHKFDIGQAH